MIHPDGTVTYYVTGDLKPEVRARIDAQIRVEDEAKAKRKREYERISEEAAKRWRQETALTDSGAAVCIIDKLERFSGR